MPDEIAKAAEEIVESIVGKGFEKCLAVKAFNCANVDDCVNKIDRIVAIITRCCEAKDRRIAELEARLANVEEASRVMVGIAGNRGKEDMECPFPEK